jgi:hypothetical protein
MRYRKPRGDMSDRSNRSEMRYRKPRGDMSDRSEMRSMRCMTTVIKVRYMKYMTNMNTRKYVSNRIFTSVNSRSESIL